MAVFAKSTPCPNQFECLCRGAKWRRWWWWWRWSKILTTSRSRWWWWWTLNSSSNGALRWLPTNRRSRSTRSGASRTRCILRASSIIVLPRPNNTSHHSYDDNDEYGDSDDDDSFLGGIKWSLFFFGKRIGFLSLNRSLNAVSCFWVNCCCCCYLRRR